MSKSLKDFRAEFDALDADALHNAYMELFGIAAAGEDGELTGDLVGLRKKLTYAAYIKTIKDAGLEVPPKVDAAAKEIFDAPFKVGKGKKAPKEKKAPRYTIQMFITETLNALVKTGEHKTIEELGQMVVDRFPSSTYVKDPVGRMRVDINKYNTGIFECQKSMNMIPADATEHYKPAPSAASERKTREKKPEAVAPAE